MDRRKVLQLLGVATATGAVLGTTVASGNAVPLPRTVTESINLIPNENGRGYYWTENLVLHGKKFQRMYVVLQDAMDMHTTVNGKRYWNPVVCADTSNCTNDRDTQALKTKLFAALEAYWTNPQPAEKNWSRDFANEAKIDHIYRVM